MVQVGRRVSDFIAQHQLLVPNAHVLVALSGGADSVALLRILMRLGYRCHAVHCNFHLRGEESNRDERFVVSLCESLNVPCEVVHFDTQTASEEENVDKETELYNAVYKEISEIVGLDATLKIYLRFKGQQISFPVRLYNPNLIQQKVIKEFDGTNIQELAQKYDYSEKTIRRMIRDSVEEPLKETK